VLIFSDSKIKMNFDNDEEFEHDKIFAQEKSRLEYL